MFVHNVYMDGLVWGGLFIIIHAPLIAIDVQALNLCTVLVQYITMALIRSSIVLFSSE